MIAPWIPVRDSVPEPIPYVMIFPAGKQIVIDDKISTIRDEIGMVREVFMTIESHDGLFAVDTRYPSATLEPRPGDRVHAEPHRPWGIGCGHGGVLVVYPGQATAYKVGMMKILDRQRAKDELGEQFDIREFHRPCRQRRTAASDSNGWLNFIAGRTS